MTDFRFVNPIRIGRGLDQVHRVDYRTHQAVHGALVRRRYRDLVELAQAVDLRGRGGAAFPFHRKLSAVVKSARDRGVQPVVLINATEGEPAARKDHFLLEHTPHLILDGALLAASAIGARQVVVAVTDQGQPGRSMRNAIGERGVGGFVRMVLLPERFVTGEGGALVNGVNGNPAIPPGRKVRASDRGVDGLPTLLSNAETYAQLALISQMGPNEYATVGTREEPGTVLLTVWGMDGKVRIVETPAGVPLTQVLDLAGTNAGQAVLIGGYHGAWLTPESVNRAHVSRDGIRREGAALGAGVIVPLDAEVCPLGEVARVAAYMGNESAGQCGPCRLGLPALARSLNALAAGSHGNEALNAVRAGTQTVIGRGACSHPDGTARFVTSSLKVFAGDIETHLADGTCGRPVKGLLPIADGTPLPTMESSEDTGLKLAVDWSRCAAHGLCGYLAPGLVRLDEFGFPVIRDAAVPKRLLRDARVAVEMCPALALRLGADAHRPAAKAGR